MKALFLGFILVCGVGFSQNKTDAQGRKQGPWRKYQPGDKILIYTGQFKDDIPVGEFRYYYPSGKVKSIVQHESKRVSYSWFYNESEVLILEGKFVDKKRDSVWREYNNRGLLLSEGTYKNNRLQGPRKEYFLEEQELQGVLICRKAENYVDSLLQGPFVEYYSSGKERMKGAYHLGMKEGWWINYYPNGQCEFKVKYRKDSRYGYAYGYDDQGTLLSTSYFLDNRKLSPKEFKFYVKTCKEKGIEPEE
jgi:antitoxin component YwqK of YwqJK toxin-antitoxin module